MEKNKTEEIKKKLFKKDKNIFLKGNVEKEDIFKFAEEYKWFLENSKTERMATKTIISILEKNGYVNIDTISKLNFRRQSIFK